MKDIKQVRTEFDQLGNLYPKVATVKIEQSTISGVNTYWFTPENALEGKLIIYLHGGVYALGSIRSHGSLVSHVADKLKTKVLFIDYLLAPENPYPAANNEVFSVYLTLLKDSSISSIGFIGDSAGGGLIVSAVAAMLKLQLPLPGAVAMISPWIDLECNYPSYENNKSKDPVLNRDLLANAAKGYLSGASMETSNPKNATLSNFSRTLIVVGTNEVLEDDSKRLYNNIKGIQPDTTLTIYENQTHVWPLSNIGSEASQKLLTELDNFFNVKPK